MYSVNVTIDAIELLIQLSPGVCAWQTTRSCVRLSLLCIFMHGLSREDMGFLSSTSNFVTRTSRLQNLLNIRLRAEASEPNAQHRYFWPPRRWRSNRQTEQMGRIRCGTFIADIHYTTKKYSSFTTSLHLCQRSTKQRVQPHSTRYRTSSD